MEQRIELVERAVLATLEGDSSVVDRAFAPDVHATLTTNVWSSPALGVEIEDRAGAFDDVLLHVTRWRAVGDELWVEWTASVVHVGPLRIEDVVIPPTGRRTELHGITVAEFADDRIGGFREYWDTTALMRDDACGRPPRGRPQRG